MTATPGVERYPHLFSPFRLGAIELANRLVIPALTTNYGNDDGTVSDKLVTYMGRRAQGGFGLITTENIGVHPGGRVMAQMIMADDDRYIPGLARLARAIKDRGVPAFAQLSHPGRQTKSKISGAELVARRRSRVRSTARCRAPSTSTRWWRWKAPSPTRRRGCRRPASTVSRSTPGTVT